MSGLSFVIREFKSYEISVKKVHNDALLNEKAPFCVLDWALALYFEPAFGP